jgi:Glycosyl transferase family 2/Methyltransferase domain
MNKVKCLIVSAMRDEGPYILEWIAFHRSIGVTDFLIYTNDCRDGTDLLLERLQQNGVLTHVRNKVLKRGPQKSAFKAAMRHPAYLEADWVLASDVDEFLNIKIRTGQIEDLLELYPDADAIPVCWRMFSNNEHEKIIAGFSIEALTDAESPDADPAAVGRFVKSLFKPNPEIVRIGTHAPVYTEEFEAKAKWGTPWCTPKNPDDPRRPRTDYGYDIAQMNHYAVRAVDPFLLKRDRGDVNYMANRLELDYWARWCRGGSKDDTILERVPGMKNELKELTKDPIVRQLHNGAIEFHQNRIRELLNTAEYQNLKKQIGALSSPKRTLENQTNPNLAATELALKAPGRHKNRLRMLEQMPKNGRCAEIGVWNGGFSEAILEVTKPKELVLIDPWDLLSKQSEEERTHKKHADTDFMGEMFQNVSDRYGQLENVTIVKGFSSDVLSAYPDNYFDWVYIDGNHQYEYVKKDIELAFKKVRAGGIIAGDDFFWKRNERLHVKEAVLDMMRRHGMANRPTRIGQQYMITVPDKPLVIAESA